MSYVYKPSGRQADHMAAIARRLSAYSGETIGLSALYLAVAERTIVEYAGKGPRESHRQLQPYLNRSTGGHI